MRKLPLISLFVLISLNSMALANPGASAGHQKVIDHWTGSRMKEAIPRDLVIDPRGLGYLKGKNNELIPYGHQVKAVTAANIEAQNRPGGSGDSAPPVVTNMSPSDGQVIGYSYTFSANVDDPSGVKSVSFVIEFPNGNTQSFNPGLSGGNLWSVTLQGFSDGNWRWWVVAKDKSGKGGNTGTSDKVAFLVDISDGDTGGNNGSGDTIINAVWDQGGTVQAAAGRIYFEMPKNNRLRRWAGYVCSGTVVTDEVTERSVILTAAHCVYDDVNKAFARNVLFIPNQAGTTGSGTDLNCNNDPIGCWTPAYGVVDTQWAQGKFPNNKTWDYAFYVVSDSDSHSGTGASSNILDNAVEPMTINFAEPYANDGESGNTSLDFTHGLGYSYSEDPKFMYCAEDMTMEGAANWWLPSCELSGGSSGGPWVQKLINGNGPLISVNSWGYTDAPGMAGPMLHNSTAQCLFNYAKVEPAPVSSADGESSTVVSCQ